MIQNKTEKIEKITVDGVDFPTTDLPQELQKLTSLYEQVFAEMRDLEDQVKVRQFAMQQMGAALVEGIQQNVIKKEKEKETQTGNVVPITPPVNISIAPATGSTNAVS